MCGAFATFTHDVILTPMDVVKQRLQLGCYRGALDCVATVCRQEGLGALYRSMPVTLAMNLPFGGVLVATNESLKQLLKLESKARNGEDARGLLPRFFLTAGLSGAVASVATQPLDVIKTRLQTQDVFAQAGTAALKGPEEVRGDAEVRVLPKYQGIIHAAKVVMAEEGPWGFFKGLTARVVYCTPAAAVSWGTYESVKYLLHRATPTAPPLSRLSGEGVGVVGGRGGGAVER